MTIRSGPLLGVKVLEFPAIGPVPFAGMLFADLGADVVRIDRAGGEGLANDIHGRGKRSIVLDFKTATDVRTAHALIEKADVLLEGFRPGVMEKLGFGPDAVNPRVIYGRMTGWGQHGPLARSAGHDINYIALTGALASIGPHAKTPQPPLNLVGDYGGGAMFLVVGVLAALHERASSHRGQVVDAAMVDGAGALMSIFTTLMQHKISPVRRGNTLLDGSAPFYRTYECADGRFVSIGALEPHFYKLLWEKLGQDAPNSIPSQDPKDWERATATLTEIFMRRSRDEWCAVLEGTDACFAPVLELEEAPGHPHLHARQSFVEAFGVTQPNVAPRFSRTPGRVQGAPPTAGEGGADALIAWGVSPGPCPQFEV